MKIHPVILVSIVILMGCGESSEPKQNGTQTAAPSPATTAPPKATLPSVPLELLERIFKEGTQVDYIFYNYSFTTSQAEPASVQYSTRIIAEEPAPMKPECQPAGRISWQIKGNIVLEGNFYFSTGCTYFIFDEKGQPKYSNYMTDEGIRFFNDLIQQGLRMQKQAQ